VSDKDTNDNDGGIVTSATGGKVYHQPDEPATPPLALEPREQLTLATDTPALPEAPPKRTVGRPAVRGNRPRASDGASLKLVAAPAAPVPPPPAPPPVANVAVDDVRARARAIVDAARLVRKVDKHDPTIETIEIRRRATEPVGEAGTLTTYTGDEALIELAQFCTDYLMSIGYLPPQVDEYAYVDENDVS
jgi:hypothetical protein